MTLRDEALLQVVGLDAGRSAQLSLRVAQDEVRAASGAVYAIAKERLVLFATTELVEGDMQRVESCWRDSRQQLVDGQPVIEGDWAIVPIGRPATGLLYLGNAQYTLDAVSLQHVAVELGRILEMAISLREREPEIRLLYEALIARTPLRLLNREKLLLTLRVHGWNKSRVARELQITRATLYRWIQRHGIEETR